MGTLRTLPFCLLVFFSALFASASDTKEDYFEDGLEFEFKGNTEKAIQEYQQALAIDPLYIPVHRRLMDVLKKQGKTSEVQTTYQRLLDSYPNQASTLYLYARSLEDNTKARDFYFRSIQIDPNFPWSYMGLQYIYRVKNLYEKAFYYCLEGLKANPGHSGLRYNLGNLYSQTGDRQKAIQEFSKVLDDLEFGGLALSDLGDIYYSQEQYLKAGEFYKKALKFSPDNAELHRRIGFIYYEVEKSYDKAAEEFKKCYELDSKNRLIRINLGHYFKKIKKDYKEAERWFRAAIEMDSKDSLALSELVEVLMLQQKYDEALNHISQLKQLNPLNSIAYTNAGIVYDHLNKHRSALNEFRTAYELDPNPYPHYWNIGLMYEELGEYEKAAKVFQLLSEEQTENPVTAKLPQKITSARHVLENIYIRIDNVYTEPELVRPGQKVRLVIEYTIDGIEGKQVLIAEKRSILLGNNLLGSPLYDFVTHADGKYRTFSELVVPANAAPGNYIIKGNLKVVGLRVEKVGAFRVH